MNKPQKQLLSQQGGLGTSLQHSHLLDPIHGGAPDPQPAAPSVQSRSQLQAPWQQNPG